MNDSPDSHPDSGLFESLKGLAVRGVSIVKTRLELLSVELAEVVPDNTARRDNAGRIVRRQIRTDHVPTLPAVRCLEDDLAAVIHGVVIERVDRERWRAVAAVDKIVRLGIQRVHPWADRAGARSIQRTSSEGINLAVHRRS